MSTLTPETRSGTTPTAATTWVAPYDYYHQRYQAYYTAGLRHALAELGVGVRSRSLQRLPGVLRALRRVRSSHALSRVMGGRSGGWLDRAAGWLGGPTPAGGFHPLVGRYEFAFHGGRAVRVAIDAADGGELVSPEIAAASDLYFKTNYRPALDYPPQVVPACNLNPLVLPHLDTLRAYRRHPKTTDVCFVVRVWGGRNEADGVEHNLRLLEAVHRARCSKRLVAYLVAGDLAAQEARLQQQGIPTTRTPVPLRDLWAMSAASRVNVLRLGMHNCIPWRCTDVLAMGGCAAFDQPAQTVWDPPLAGGREYLDLGAVTTPERPLATDREYAEVPERIEAFVHDRERVERVAAAAADYFDDHASPSAVGGKILARVLHAAGAPV